MTDPTQPMGVQHRAVETNGIRLYLAEAGRTTDPLILLLHGFPESWYSWRHQLEALAEAGLHVVAPDQRGYGRSARPESIDQYSILHLVGDVVGLLDALGERQAVVVGHDWGAPVAWHTALFRPDRVRGVVGLSVPYRPRGSRSPLSVYRGTFGEDFYQLYFQEPGVAEVDLERDVRRTMRLVLYGASGDNPVLPSMVVDRGRGFLGEIDVPEHLPSWLRQDDLDFYVAEFERTGFAGGLNWYRNIERNWELTAAWRGAQVHVPALFMVGNRDVVYHFPGMAELIRTLPMCVPNLRDRIVVEGGGHWIQQERASDVNAALLDFVHGLP